jgi:hypothetical protein
MLGSARVQSLKLRSLHDISEVTLRGGRSSNVEALQRKALSRCAQEMLQCLVQKCSTSCLDTAFGASAQL